MADIKLTYFMRSWTTNIEAQIGEGPFLGGDAIGVADLKLYVVMRWFVNGGVDHIPGVVFADSPKMMALFEAAHSHPKVVAWAARFDR